MPLDTPLALWGIDDEAEQVYRTILRLSEAAVDELVAALGVPAGRVRQSAAALLEAQLVREVPGGYAAVGPVTAIESLVDREQRRLADRARRLAEARQSIASYASEHGRSARRARPRREIEVVGREDAAEVLTDLVRTTEGPLRCSYLVVGTTVERHAELVAELLGQVAGGRPMLALYPTRILEVPEERAHARYWAEHGEQGRLAVSVPHSFIVFGTEAAVVGAQWGRRTEQAFVLRVPALVAAFASLFDSVWAEAVPLVRIEAGGMERDRRRILELLALGAKDETIARQLGLSLRTVRRRVSELMDELGADTRFAAGFQAARRELV
ncbi:MAG: helix-turn-helix domain-containing protein [Actinomycetes bacterium]